jgi:hypothetical protein
LGLCPAETFRNRRRRDPQLGGDLLERYRAGNVEIATLVRYPEGLSLSVGESLARRFVLVLAREST